MKRGVYAVVIVVLLTVLAACAKTSSEAPPVIYPDPFENPGAYSGPHGGPVK